MEFCDTYKMEIEMKSRVKYKILSQIKANILKSVKNVFMFDINGLDVLIITKYDEVYGMGINKFGTLGLGHKKEVKELLLIDDLCAKGFINFESGYDFMVGLTKNGEVYTWGKGHKGRLGNGLNDNHVFIPKMIVSASDGMKIVDIKCTVCSTNMLTTSGTIYWFGYKGFNNTEQLSPVGVFNDTNVGHFVELGCGVDHSLALTSDGRVYAWGRNDMMQLGLGHSRHTDTPSAVELTPNVCVQKIAVGSNHNLLLTREGCIYTFGDNSCGQLGIGNQVNQNIPQLLVKCNQFVDIFATDQKSMALSDKCFVYIWGQTKRGNILRPERTEWHSFQEAIDQYCKPVFTHKPLTYEQLFEKRERIYRIISSAFNSEKYSDLKIKINDHFIYVHKWFVSENCKHFDTMFANEWTECKTNIIEITGHSYEGYYEFMRYLYTNMFHTNNIDVLIDVLNICDEYMESDIKLKCVQHIKPLIELQNVCLIYGSALKYSSNELEVYCFEYMVFRLDQIIDTQGYHQMDDKYSKHLFTHYIRYLKEINSQKDCVNS